MRRLLLSILALALAGCAGYKLGPTNGLPAGSRSVQVNAFLNRTREPRVTEYLAASLRRQLQQDGTFRLETTGGADIVLTGEIIRFNRTGLSYQTNDVLTPQEYTLTLVARVVAKEAHSGKVEFDRNVQGRTYIRIGNDQSSAERQAIPILTDDLARNAVSFLVDGSW
jgi:outer membrane lipopolysaccharide assembly protein LptE/RlpB